MNKWRCVNNPMQYNCKEEPDWEVQPKQIKVAEEANTTYPLAGKCKLDPKTCGKSIDVKTTVDPSKVPTGTYRNRKELKQEQANKTKKPAGLQGRMFD